MRAREFLQEAQATGTPTRARVMDAPRVSTMDRSAPWTRAAMGQARQRKRSFEELPTDKEKFDFLYTLKKGRTTNRIVIPRGRQNLQIKSYDPATGDITMTLSTGQQIDTYTGNTNNFKFHKSEKSAAGGPRNYIFSPGSVELVDSARQSDLRGRPKKKQYTFPNMPW